MKNVIVGQSGGPTAVINSSVAGVYLAAKELGSDHIYGILRLFDQHWLLSWYCHI